ncbi:MAG: hypothetical protein U0T83_11445 [Bacteriovoracaceae bacterium]
MKKLFKELRDKNDLKVIERSDLSTQSKIKILDTMIDYIDFEYANRDFNRG